MAKKIKKKEVIVENPETIIEVNEVAVENSEAIIDVLEIKDEVVVDLTPEVKEAFPEVEEVLTFVPAVVVKSCNDEHQKLIKELREKLTNGTISDGEAAELFNLLAL